MTTVVHKTKDKPDLHNRAQHEVLTTKNKAPRPFS